MTNNDRVTGAAALLATYAAVFALYLVVPGRWVEGYVKDQSGRPLRYHLNGLAVFVLSVGAFAALAHAEIVPWNFFYVHRYETLATAFVIGVVFTLAIVLRQMPTGRGLFKDLYLGRLENPQRGRIDAKMFLYLIGAVMLELNLVSFAAHHVLTHDAPSPGVFLYTALFTFFLVEYLFFERVHLYTYDFVAERVGFKLGWGCLVFYPFFYCVGLWFAAEQPSPETPLPLLVLYAALFFLGWTFARGANLQKYAFKTAPDRKRFGPFEQRAIGGRVLASGFWGLSRHVNYLGEILMASALALALGYPASLWPWMYPLYYIVLLVPRQIADDARCKEKYGPIWDEYVAQVPRRIVPGLF